MSDQELQKELIQARNLIDDYLNRIGQTRQQPTSKKNIAATSSGEKKITLREIVRRKKFNNGQEQVAVIVGYYEKVVGSLINKNVIPTEWVKAKMMNKYNTAYFSRAKDDLIRMHQDGTCDLTQTGEDFFDNFLSDESTQTTS